MIHIPPVVALMRVLLLALSADGVLEWNTLAPGSMGEPAYAHCFTYGAPTIQGLTFETSTAPARCEVRVAASRPELSRTMPIVRVAMLYLSAPGDPWRCIAFSRSPKDPTRWTASLGIGREPVAYAVYVRDASGHMAVRLPAVRGERRYFPLTDDPDESPALTPGDMDLLRIGAGTDGKHLYLRMTTQAKPNWGASNPLFLHIYGMGTLKPGVGADAIRQLVGFGPALKMAGMPSVIVASPDDIGKGLKDSGEAQARMTEDDVRIKVRLDAIERDLDGSILASFVTAAFHGTDMTLRDGSAPIRVYLPKDGDEPVPVDAPPFDVRLPTTPSPHTPSTRPATRLEEPVRIANAAQLEDDDPHFPYRTGTMVRKIQSAAPPERLTFAVISDTHSHPSLYPYLLERVEDLHPAFMINVGDMVEVGLPDRYARYMEMTKGFDLPWLSVLGNHDTIRNRTWQQYRRHFGPPDYWFDYGPARFIVLNSVTFNFFDSQLEHLDQLLDTPLRKLVFMHRPLHYLNPRWSTPVTGGSARFKEIVERRKVDRVVTGHMHLFSRRVIGGVTYIVCAGGGGVLDIRGEGGVHHIVLLTVSREAVHDMIVLPNFSSNPSNGSGPQEETKGDRP